MSELKQLEMQKDDEMEIDLGEIFHLLMNKLWIIVLCFIIGATLAFGGTKLLITPKYSASSMIYILTKTTSVTSLADIQMGTQLTADFEILATSRPVLEEVIEKLNLDYTYEELKSMIQTDNQTDTRILRFTVLDANAKEAKKIANELADVTAERVAYVMSSDKPKVVEEAVVPKYPSSPNTKKNTAMGGLAFAFVAATVIVLRYLMNDTIQTEEDIKKLADAQGKSVETIKAIIESLKEFNPMMGHRGCRLTVTYPEIAVMQTKAVIRAALSVQAKHADWTIVPEIMIPLVGEEKELKYVKKIVVKTADEEIKAAGSDMKYEVGTMIEIPRAALLADEIAKEAEFFCFGTNDLTQMTFGFSRDDAGKFLDAYYDAKIFENDPFAKLDQNGVGKLMDMAVKLGKGQRPELHCGICGEHGGDPSSVEFCHRIGLDYVSCSPFRVPIARLAAAQAAIAEKRK